MTTENKISVWRGYHAILYPKGHGHIPAMQWQWVNPAKARRLIDEGVAEYYDPTTVPAPRPKPKLKKTELVYPKSYDITTIDQPPAYVPIPVKELTMEHLWRKIFVSMKKAGYPVRESMTKAQLLEMRDAEK